MPGSKHLIQCHCVLPQYRNLDSPIFHKFVVFSRIDPGGSIIPEFKRCNNCGVIHKIVDFCRSEVAHGVDDAFAISSEDDMREFLSEKVCKILDDHKCDIATWEQITDIISNSEWGSVVIISKQSAMGSTQVKGMIINDKNSFKIDTHLRQDDIG